MNDSTTVQQPRIGERQTLHIERSKKALRSRRLRLEFTVEHALYIFLFLVPFLCGEDLNHLNNTSKAPDGKAKSGKEAHLNGRIKTQRSSSLPALHASGADARTILIRPYEKGEVKYGRNGKYSRDVQIEHSQNLVYPRLFLPMN